MTKKADFAKNPSFWFYVFYDCRGWYTDDISGSKPPSVCLWQLFKLCKSFFGEFWRKIAWIRPSRQKYDQKTAIFAFSKLEKATELPKGLQPIDICFSRLDIFTRDSLDVQLDHIKSSKQSHKSSLIYDSKRSRWCLFFVRKMTFLPLLRYFPY